ncbi:MAG: T9SS type A sorting domain-containing protein [Candidatus Eisenbacteria sp.]|nr:T9SS type A sorting domain-containing protein [Candidatus Eisenbacteria bacterium]
MARWYVALLLSSTILLPATRSFSAPVRVEFRFQHESASTVNLAGSFNSWCNPGPGGIDTGIDPMGGPDSDSWWTLEKLLDPGDYEYKFVVDGNQWFTDPLNPRINHSNYDNSMLEVTNPLVYYLQPMDGSLESNPLPEISAYLARSDGSSFDLDELRILLDGDLVAEGAPHYDPSTHRVSFTPADTLESGMHGAKVRVALVGGALDADTTAFEIDADLSPPAIAHVPPAGASANAAVHLECTITDDQGVESARLFYRNAGGPGFVEAALHEGLEEVWTGTVVSGFTVAGTDLEYYFEADDRTNTTRDPSGGTHSIVVTPDTTPPVISEAFTSPTPFSPAWVNNETRLSFYLSEPTVTTVEVTTVGGSPVRTLISSGNLGPGYHQTVWDGRDGGGAPLPEDAYVFHINGMDAAGLPTEAVTVPVVVDNSSESGPIRVVVLFHANQTLNHYGDIANDVCFNGLLDVLRRHPQLKFAIHFSGTLLHDLSWFNFRHSPSTIDMLRAGHTDGQFEIIGSTYAQNVPYATHMWDNERQLEVHREVIQKILGAEPKIFWNAERCWKQGLVPLLADHGYQSTWVESHILWDSGSSAPEHAVRKTRLGDDEVIVFNDDGDFIGLLDSAINSGYSGDLIGYLDWLRSQDTYRDWVVCYAQDAETSGLWDYEGGGDPQDNWDNLDQVLTDLENTGWIQFTTFSEYLEDRFPTEELTPIVDGQANWMVWPSQQAGYADWFDFNERSPLLAAYRDFYTGLRARIQEVEALVSPGTPAANLVKHAIWNLAAHQFEFGCIGCGNLGCQDYQKAETLEGALLAAEACLGKRKGTGIEQVDANGDSIPDWVITTPTDLYILSDTGGRLLRWFDLNRGEEVLGNELFMWGLYYLGWRHWFSGSGYNDDQHYMDDAEWTAPNWVPAAQPFHRSYGTRKHAFNDFLSIDGGAGTVILDAGYAATVNGDTLKFTYAGSGLSITKNWIAQDAVLEVVYELSNTSGASHLYELRIESELNPSLLEVMNGGRGTLMYWDGTDTSTSPTPLSVGVVNVLTEQAVEFSFSEPPATITGGETVHGLLYGPTFEFSMDPGQTKTLHLFVGARMTSVDARDEDALQSRPLRLHQNYPNPFNPVTNILFELPSAGEVSLRVYDVLGRRVRTLVDALMPAGHHPVVWDGTDDDGHRVSTGLYLYRLEHEGHIRSMKMVLLK